jgi:hypothetical protein
MHPLRRSKDLKALISQIRLIVPPGRQQPGIAVKWSNALAEALILFRRQIHVNRNNFCNFSLLIV